MVGWVEEGRIVVNRRMAKREERGNIWSWVCGQLARVVVRV